jgi:predicted AlkP superfamily pyrophosphatase or phosphodiesterase
MPSRICVIDIPGLSQELLQEIPGTSALGLWLANQHILGLTPSFPALTCSVQATLTTGVDPEKHGIIANGVPTFRSSDDQKLVDAANFADYRRQISFWEQSNQFLDAPRFWQTSSGKGRWKTALLFFQNSMPGFAGAAQPAADIVLTPKPDHGPDGKLVNLCWSDPADLVPRLFKELGPFPLMNYWGPMAGIASSQWIARAASIIWREHNPQLQWVYVPHLDYDLQKFGPSSAQAKTAVRDVAVAIEPLITEVLGSGSKLVLLSEYAMRDVNAVVQPNAILKRDGFLVTRQTSEGALIDFEKSDAVAMVDHQIAHIYVNRPEQIETIARALHTMNVHAILRRSVAGIRHRRAGDLILLAEPHAWFDYRWWLEPADAPSFAKTVDIHRKPGYDPTELFWDRSTSGTSQNPTLVKGSHGLAAPGEAVLIGDFPKRDEPVLATEVAGLLALALNEP